MSEKTEAPKAEGTEAKGKAKAPKKNLVTAATKTPKKEWTVQACKKAAGRFTTEEEWANGAPSSYKVATHHGWINECLSHMQSRSGAKTPMRRSA